MIAITGIGIICSLGNNQNEAFNTLLNFEKYKNSIFTEPKNISESFRSMGTPVVAAVSMSNRQLFNMLNIPNLKLNKLSRTSLFALNAIKEAILDAKLEGSNIQPKRIGIFGGTTLAGTDRLECAVREYETSGTLTNPELLSYTNYSSILDIIAKTFNFCGSRVMVSTACSSSTVVMRFAQQMLLKRELDVAIVFGADPITETSLAGFSALGALNDGVSSPFSVEKLGISLGEGAAALVLEYNPSRKIEKYAWLGGVGLASEGYHLTAPEPSGRGAIEAMNDALIHSRRSKDEIMMVIAHGTGTELNDNSEANAVKKTFENSPHVISTKGASGHTLGGAGAINAVIACMCIKNNLVFASPMYTRSRKNIDIKIANKNIHLENLTGAITNSFGFGGSVASAAFYKDKFVGNSKEYIENGEKVFITGIGLITPLGPSIEFLEKAILEGSRHFIEEPPNISFTGLRSVRYSGKINLENEIGVKNLLRKSRHFRKMDRTTMLSYFATLMAMQNSNFKISIKDQKNIGIFLGTDTGPIDVLEKFYNSIITGGRQAGNPSLFPNTVLNTCLGFITMDFQIKGPSVLVSQGDVASSVAMSLSRDLLTDPNGNCKAVFCGGVDELTDFQVKGYLDLLLVPDNAGVNSTTEPLSKNAKGFLMGEASVVFLLEKGSELKIKNSNKHIVEFVGSVHSGNVSKKYKINKDNLLDYSSSVTEAIDNAIKLHGMPDLIVTNASGYQIHDQLIITGISNSEARSVNYYSPLRIFGNCRGTSGALGVFTAITAIKHQVLPSTDQKSLSISGIVFTVYVLSVDVGGYVVINVIRKS